MPNMAAVSWQHNSSILGVEGPLAKTTGVEGRTTQCRVKENCLLNGTCEVQSVVYKATIKTTSDERDYTGLTPKTFKHSYNAHQHSMRDSKYRNVQHVLVEADVWALKDQRIGYNMQVERAAES